MLVRELMTHDPVTVTPATPVKTALGLLVEHRITSMPVLYRHGRLAGVVSEADLIRDLVPGDRRAHEVPPGDDALRDRPAVVGDVMTTHAITVHPDDDVADAVELLTSTTVKSVPVTERDGALAGMLSRSDIVRMLATADEDLAREVEARLTSAGLGEWMAEVTDGTVSLQGPDDSPDRAVARLLASTVPGVVEVTRD